MDTDKTDNKLTSSVLKTLHNGDYFANPIPQYISQFASRELISDILDKHIPVDSDPKWRDLGFDSIEEYSFWAQRLCGLVCIKMVMDSLKPELSESIGSLTKKAVERGGYIIYDESRIFVDKGWFYAPLIELVKEYGLSGAVCNPLNENELCINVIENSFSIVSVQPGVIRFDIEKCPSDKKGGHLVVITGFKWDKEQCLGFYIHNPSGRKVSTQENAFIPIERFREAFASKGLVIRK